jgi:chromosome segregation ATPase
MNTNRLAHQLEIYLQQVRDDACADYLSEIQVALQRLSEIPECLQLDVESILKKANSEVFDDPRKEKSLSLGFISRFKNPFDTKNNELDRLKRILDTLNHPFGLNDFLTLREVTTKSLLLDIIKKLQKPIQRLKAERDQSRFEIIDLNARLAELDKACSRLRDEHDIQISHISRDCQMILASIGTAPKSKPENDIKRIAEGMLEDLGITIMWAQSELADGKHFIIQKDPGVKVMRVVRPCLLRNSEVVQKGLVIKPNT